VARELLGDLPEDRPVLVVAHGNAGEPVYNAELLALKEELAAHRPDLHLTLLEGDPDGPALDRFLEKARRHGKAHVVPFLLVAGGHVQKAILGEESCSLRSRLGVPGFTCGPALGHRPWARRLFLDRLGAALACLEVP
jgi:sirohydrochlorin ferrochelatase